jgi:hypothetical protein
MRVIVVATDLHKALTAQLLFVWLCLAAKRVINELPVTGNEKLHVVIRYALWSRSLISGCLFSVAAGFASPPLVLSALSSLINLNEIRVLRKRQF